MKARNFKNLQTSIIGQEADLAAHIVGLTDGKKLNDPEHRQTCLICGRSDCFYFQQATAKFCCSQCNFSGELIQLIYKAKQVSHNEAYDIIETAITAIAENANTLNSGDVLQMDDDQEIGELPSTVDTMSKNAGENRDNDSVNGVNSEKTHLLHDDVAPPKTIRDYAQKCIQWGLCAIPPAKGEKRPLGNWKEYQKRMPINAEWKRWQEDGYSSMGIVCGSISGNLLVIDFDKQGEAFEDFKTAIPMELWQYLVIERSPSGGYHIFIRSEQPVNGNTVLAKDANGEVLIETRGEGGFIVCHPSPGYTLVQGSFDDIQVMEEPYWIDFLLDTARSFDQTPKPVPQPLTQDVPTSSHTGNTDFDWFVQSGEWIKHLPDLELLGWKFTHEKDGQLFFQTPDGDRGNGKHDGNIKDGVAYFFSKAPFPFEEEKGYSICRLFAGVLFGDFGKKGLAKLAERYFSNKNEVCDSPADDIDIADLRYTPFPIECFSTVMQNITRGVQRTIGLKDSSAPATSCLAVFSAVIGASCKIRIKRGYEQPAHIFTGIVRKSGRAKSPVTEYFLEIFEQKQSEWVDEWNVTNDTHKRKMAAWNAKSKDKRGDCPDESGGRQKLDSGISYERSL